MKYIIVIMTAFLVAMSSNLEASNKDKADEYLDKLQTIDPEIRKMFPRWIICEPELQIQIRRAFVLAGYDKTKLDQNRIEVLAVPKTGNRVMPYTLLFVSCGEAGMNASEINKYLRSLKAIISGAKKFVSAENFEFKRDYCFEIIPPDAALSGEQSKAIVDYFEPTDKTHAITVSLFEQSLKLGESGFWLKNVIGHDNIGYPFWSAGENKVILKRPLLKNKDAKTFSAIPNLMDVQLGVAYNNAGGLDNNSGVLDWVTGRQLNNFPGGKVVGAVDFSLPMHPQAGVHVDVELPLNSLSDEDIKKGDFYCYDLNMINGRSNLIHTTPPSPGNTEDEIVVYDNLVAPILRETGRVSVFYNFWFSDPSPENFVRVDLGLNYTEITEVAVYDVEKANSAGSVRHLYNDGVIGLKTYKPSELGDWIYFKVEYRSMSNFPFGVSFQYANQILLSRLYVPLVSDWLLLDCKYSTPLRSAMPYEAENGFFMISPVIRLTL